MTEQHLLAQADFFVEPSAATSLIAIKNLCRAGKIKKSESVDITLTGSGLKDSEVFKEHQPKFNISNIYQIELELSKILTNSKR